MLQISGQRTELWTALSQMFRFLSRSHAASLFARDRCVPTVNSREVAIQLSDVPVLASQSPVKSKRINAFLHSQWRSHNELPEFSFAISKAVLEILPQRTLVGTPLSKHVNDNYFIQKTPLLVGPQHFFFPNAIWFFALLHSMIYLPCASSRQCPFRNQTNLHYYLGKENAAINRSRKTAPLVASVRATRIQSRCVVTRTSPSQLVSTCTAVCQMSGLAEMREHLDQILF